MSGMSTKDDALIDAMLDAYHKSNLVQWEDVSLTSLQKESVRRDMRAALAVARKAILDEAAVVAEGVFSGTSNLGTPQKNEFYGGGERWHSGSIYDEGRTDAADAIRSLANQEQ